MTDNYFVLAKLVIDECPQAAEAIAKHFELIENDLAAPYYSAAAEFVNLYNYKNKPRQNHNRLYPGWSW